MSNHNFKSTAVLRERLRLVDIKPKSIKINNTSIVIFLQKYVEKLKLLSMSNLLGIDINGSLYRDSYTLHENIERYYLNFFKTALWLKNRVLVKIYALNLEHIRYSSTLYQRRSNSNPQWKNGLTMILFALVLRFQNQSIATGHKVYTTFWKLIGMKAFWNKYENPAPHRINNISKRAYKTFYIHFLKNNQSKKFVFKERNSTKSTHSHCLLEESHTYLNTTATCKNCRGTFSFFIRVQ